MKKIFSIIAVAIVAASGDAYAQYSADALRFSQTNYGSSARFKGMGNAQIGVGGDISSLGANPAGLGLFTRSEFVFTPEFNGTSLKTNYLNNNSTNNKSQINLNQLGAVFHMPTYRAKGQDTQKGIISASVGIGYSRNNDYGLEADFSGTNTTSSVYNMFGDFSVPPPNTQAINVNRTGSVSEFNLAGAINISNQIYIGATLGLVNLNYDYSMMLDEDGINDDYYVNFDVNQVTKGSGVNGKLGIIFRPISEFRIGVNLQTPTWFTIDDSTTESSNDSNIGTEVYDFSYNLRTPLKGSLGASYVFGGSALLSADVDFVDYSSIRLSSVDGGVGMQEINNSNNAIKAGYKSAVNYRVGGEVKVNDFVSLRAGYGLNGSAFKDDDANDFQTTFYSGGIGYRNKNYYFDVAYQRVQTTSTFSPYLLPDFSEPVAVSENNKNNVFLTFGIRF